MDEISAEILSAVREIRDFVRLLAEPAIAERDKNMREELRRLVGNSGLKARAVLLMDGSRTQASIQKETGFNQGNLSRFMTQLKASKLLVGDGRQPKLVISIPTNFFEGEDD